MYTYVQPTFRIQVSGKKACSHWPGPEGVATSYRMKLWCVVQPALRHVQPMLDTGLKGPEILGQKKPPTVSGQGFELHTV
jgi:hypothetical protein